MHVDDQPVKTGKGLCANPGMAKLQKSKLSDSFKDLMKQLMVCNPENRIDGAGIKDHAWFKEHVDWDAIEAGTAKPPYIPDCSKANCSTGDLDVMNQLGGDDADDVPPVSAAENVKFEGYEYNNVIEQPKEEGEEAGAAGEPQNTAQAASATEMKLEEVRDGEGST